MRKLVALILIFASCSPAQAATKELTQISTLGDVAKNVGLIVDKNILYTFGSIESSTTDAVITSFDTKGNQLAQRVIDGGGSDYISAAGSDGQGNLWFVGGDSPATSVIPVDTATSTAINPDGVVPEEIQELRKDITNIVLWRLNISSNEITRFALALNKPVLATAISVDSKGISITGIYRIKTGLQNFLVNASLAGKFSTPVTLGGTGTVINALARNNDGSVDLFGASSERLAGTKLAGKVDGVLIKVRAGKIVQVVRSSAPQAVREWVTVSASGFLVGTVQTGKKVEVAATRFISFKPVWTVRYPSTGRVIGLLNSTGAYLVYSTGTGATLATFSTKGIPGATFSSTLSSRPISIVYANAPIIMAEVANQAVLLTPASG